MSEITYQEFIDNIIQTRGRVLAKSDKERHHILPKCLGGTNEPDNLIDLELGEHFTAHKLLAEENPDCLKLRHAFWLMSHVRRVGDVYDITTPEEYTEAKLANKYNLFKTNYGNELREETKRKISIANKGKKRTPEMVEANRRRAKAYYETHDSWQKGKHLSDHHRERLREGHKHRDKSTYRGGPRSPEARALQSERIKQTYWSKSEEERRAITAKAVASRTPARYWSGKEIPQEMRDRISATLKEKHLCSPIAIKVYCADNGKTYRSITEAQNDTGVDRHIIRDYANGKRTDGKHHFELVQ